VTRQQHCPDAEPNANSVTTVSERTKPAWQMWKRSSLSYFKMYHIDLLGKNPCLALFHHTTTFILCHAINLNIEMGNHFATQFIFELEATKCICS
jgi:hypothetical protein